MSALQTEAPSAGSPTISSYRGVTASRQQQFASPSPRHSSPPWLRALSSPSPKFTAAFRPGSPSRLDIASSQPNPQLRTRPMAERTRTQSAIFPSSLGNIMSSGSKQSVSTPSGSRPPRQAQERPVSLHAALPSAVEPSVMNKTHREQQISSQMPQIVIQTPEQGYQQILRPVPQRAQSPERPHQQLPPKQTPQRIGTPNRPEQLPARQAPEPSQHRPPSKQAAPKAPTLEQPAPQRPPAKQAVPKSQTLEQPTHHQPPSKKTAKRASTLEHPPHQEPPSKPTTERAQTLEQPLHQQPPTRQNQQQRTQTSGRSHQQQASVQTTQRAQTPEPAQHPQSPGSMVQKDKTLDRPALEAHRQHVPRQIPQQAAQPSEQPPVTSDREQLQQLQTTVMELERAFRTPEPAQYQQSPTYMDSRPKNEDIPALETHHQHVPRTIPQQAAQPSAQSQVMSDHEQLQQLQITVMELARDFHNFVNATSPNHSRKGSLDSALSNHSSFSRPSSIASPTSPTASDIKDIYLRNHGKNYTSSPLAKPAATSNELANNSRNNSITSNSPTADSFLHSPKQVEGEGKSSKLRKVLSAGSMELLGGHSDSANGDHAVKPTDQEAAQQDSRNENRRQTQRISGHGIYGPKIFSKSVDNLAAASTPAASSASSMLRKVGNGMKRKSRTLSGLFRPKSVVVTGSSDIAFEAEVPAAKEPPRSQVPEYTPPLTPNTPMVKSNLSREVLYEPPETRESPSFNTNKNRVSVQVQDIGTVEKPWIAPRGILKRQSLSSPYPVEFSSTPTQILPEIASSPPLTVPNTPQTETQYDHWVNPFETTELETLMDALENVYNYDEPSESVQDANKHQPPFAPRPISYYI